MAQESLRPPVAIADVVVVLRRIWQTVLGVPVGPTDNFFDKGGDSFGAVRVLTDIREELGCEISPVDLFDRPTIAELAPVVAQFLARGEDIAVLSSGRNAP
jgi:acyl carrier protein